LLENEHVILRYDHKLRTGFKAQLRADRLRDDDLTSRGHLGGKRVHNLTSKIDLIQGIVQRIVDTAQPEKVILFGSRARGDARPKSDFDVLVIKHSDEPRYRCSVPLYVALADLPVEVEVMVYTPEEVEEWSQVPQAFVTTALREGTTIYERAADLEKQVCTTPPTRISP
jgi:predicted nucleotidyltransferase